VSEDKSMDGLTLPFQGTGSSDTAIFSIGNTGNGTGAEFTASGVGVLCESKGNDGVQGTSLDKVHSGVAGINNSGGVGVFGVGATGVSGISNSGHGVHGQNGNGSGLSPNVGTGLFGESDNGFGVYASSGTNSGVSGESQSGNGVIGLSHGPVTSGVAGINDGGGIGVFGDSKSNDGVQGTSHDKAHSGVAGINNSGGIGVFGVGAVAGRFVGSVEISGDLTILGGGDVRLADFAEDFDVSAEVEIEPGCVVVLDEAGAILESRSAYDRKVAGVISGAGNFRPAIILDRQPGQYKRTSVAMLGKVYCKVDANYAPIEVGDLLTTSPTRGHAMKADDQVKAFGSVIGKALRPHSEGRGLIPILIALQ
jgi:hypothetical protein